MHVYWHMYITKTLKILKIICYWKALLSLRTPIYLQEPMHPLWRIPHTDVQWLPRLHSRGLCRIFTTGVRLGHAFSQLAWCQHASRHPDQHGVISSFTEEIKIFSHTKNPRLVRLADHLKAVSDSMCISWRNTSHSQISFLHTYSCCCTYHSSPRLHHSHSHLCHHSEMPVGGTLYDFHMENNPFGRPHQPKRLPSSRTLRKYGKTFPLEQSI